MIQFTDSYKITLDLPGGSDSSGGKSNISSYISFSDRVQDSYNKSNSRKFLIGSDPNICGGEPIIIGTRISVVNIAEKYIVLEWNIEQIRGAYPQLSIDQIYACIEYYYNNKAKIETILMEELEADAAA